MRHPSEGLLRRLLDEPAAIAMLEREHVAHCDDCRRDLAGIREDAELVQFALTVEGLDDLDIDAAWQRLATSSANDTAEPLATGAVVVPLASRRPRRLRDVLRRPAVAGVAVAVVLAGAGTAAANEWLPVFRTEHVAPVDVRLDQLNGLPDLSAYGELVGMGDADLHEVPDEATAEAQSGLAAPEVTSVPRGVRGEPTYYVGDEVSATFTFSADRAAQAAAEAGETLPAPPAGLDGSQVRLVAGPGVLARWSQSSGVPDLVVGRAAAPRAFSSSGVPFETMRDYLLSLPGMPADVAAQLRTFNADGSTLPIPVPADQASTSSADVDGHDATVIVTRDRTMAAVVWVDDGVLTVVAGPLDRDDVLAVARSLR